MFSITERKETGKGRGPTRTGGDERDALIYGRSLGRDREAGNRERLTRKREDGRMPRIDSSASQHGEKHCISLGDLDATHDSKMVEGSGIREENSIPALDQKTSDVEGSKIDPCPSVPLSKSSRSKPRNVRNVCWPVGIDLAFNVKVPELEAWPASPLYKPVNN